MTDRMQQRQNESYQDMPCLVFKTNESARVVPPETHPGETKAWWQWTQEHVASELEAQDEAIGQVIGMKCRELRDEIALLRRELVVLREEVAVERGLKTLREEITTARADIPRLPSVEAQFAAEQADMKRELERLRRELAAAKDKISTLNLEISQTNYVLSEIEKKPSPTTIDAATLERWRQCIERWLKENEEKTEPPQLLLPHGHTLPLERGNGDPSN